jgi:hypothetical protein
MVTNRCSFICNEAMKRDIDTLCQDLRKQQGIHYAETVGALVLIGLKTVKKTGSIYPSIIREVTSHAQ